MKFQSPINLLRPREGNDHAKVTFIELFFDLVFVFTIIQLSHVLADHFTVFGVIESLLLMVAVYVIWEYFTWALNWLDPEVTLVRLWMYAVMLAGLFLSSSIPHAFSDKGLIFAIAYVFMQFGRSVFTLWAFAGRRQNNFESFKLMTIWIFVSSILWILGGLSDDPHTRLYYWSIALCIEFFGPAVGFPVPFFKKTSSKDWDISGAHMAERSGLFITICLGETILVNGGAFSELAWNITNATAFVVSFVITITLWWIYFGFGHSNATQKIEESSDPGTVAMWGFYYAHTAIVIGIIVTAVATKFMLKDPAVIGYYKVAITMIAGPVLFLLGCGVFKFVIRNKVPLSHLFGIILLVLLSFFYQHISALILAVLVCTVLFIVSIWEYLSLKFGNIFKNLN